MFRIWRVPVKGHLHAGKNLLRVVFPSPIKAAEEVAAGDPWQPDKDRAQDLYSQGRL
jgi:beta-mannosidase